MDWVRSCACREWGFIYLCCNVFLGNVRVADSAVFPFEFAAHVRFHFLFLPFAFISPLTILISFSGAISSLQLLTASVNWQLLSSKPTLMTFCSMGPHRLYDSRLPVFCWPYQRLQCFLSSRICYCYEITIRRTPTSKNPSDPNFRCHWTNLCINILLSTYLPVSR